MKMMIFAAALVVPAVVYADTLSKVEGDFVAQMIGAAAVGVDCEGVELVPNAAEMIGDRVGVGQDIRSAAIAAYTQTIPGQKINRSYLIPAVTRRVNEVMEVIETKKHDGSLCDLTISYVERGWLREKR